MSRTFFTDRDLGKALPATLRSAGFTVERFDDHFGTTTADEDWLATAGRKRWVVLTHDSGIRYKPTERDAVMEHGVGLLILVGAHPHAALAQNLVNSRATIEAFLDANPPRFIAKLYLADAAARARDARASGRIVMWLSHAEWKRRPRA